MEIELKVQDIVLIGLFNPSKFDRYTFIKNRIITEVEIKDESIFLPEVVNLISDKFNLIINSNQIIISSDSNLQTDVSKVLLKFLSLLEEINLNASGFNFRYYVEPKYNDNEVNDFVRDNFYNNNNKIQSKYFSTDNSSFGFYSSKDFEETRLKLDVKPITMYTTGLNLKSVQFEFNFHKDFDLKEKSLEALKELLNNYKKYKKECQNIIDVLS